MGDLIDLSSNLTIERKQDEDNKARKSTTDMRLIATKARTECRRNENVEDWYDVRTNKAYKHSVVLRKDRRNALDKIAEYQNRIDNCDEDIWEMEREIYELRARRGRQQDTIRIRRQDAMEL